MLKPRAALQRLAPYHPPLAGRQGLRLDFNESTIGCSPRVMAVLQQLDAELLAQYPERDPVEQEVARFLGLDPAQVLLTNGVDEAIHLVSECYLEENSEAIIAVPTFGMYRLYAECTGARMVPVQAGPNFEFPTEALLAAITPRTRLIAVANPNNPTGAVARRDDLLRLLEAAPNAAVLVDEAYYEFYGETLMDQIGRWPNLFIARTFSKAYGMAGLRAGVLAADEQQMAVLRRTATPYNVNAVALACLMEALRDQDYVNNYAAEVRRNRAVLERALGELGFSYWPSRANFVLFRVGDWRNEFVRGMKEQGILVRDRSSDPGCEGCVRITVGTDAQMERLIPALRHLAAEAAPKG
ncbi:MAG: histidinol-phosphate transaminase, partial [Candidatus Korobacteraceae bacterium]